MTKELKVLYLFVNLDSKSQTEVKNTRFRTKFSDKTCRIKKKFYI